MSDGSKIIKALRKSTRDEEIKQGYRKGYWLVRESDNQRFFIDEKINLKAWADTCRKALSNKTGYGYWIDYSSGLDIDGVTAWCNIDYTACFMDREARLYGE